MPFFVRKMNTVGYLQAPQIPAAALPLYGFIFISSGEVLVDAGGRQYLVDEGKFLLIPANTPFSIRYYHDSVGYTGGFSGKWLKDASHPVLYVGKPLMQHFIREDAAFVQEVFRRVLEDFTKGEGQMAASGMDMLLSMLRIDEGVEGSEISGRFLDMVFDHSRKFLPVTGYAEELGISPSSLNRAVRRYSNRSAVEWISISRMSLARQLLRREDMSIIDVAAAVGLDDQSYFSRFFRKNEGMTPMQYRTKVLEKS